MPAPPKRSIIAICATSALFFLLYLSFGSQTPQVPKPLLPLSTKSSSSSSASQNGDPDLRGHAIAGKIGNETLKAQLGNHAWYLFHTTFASFPDKPTSEESAALKNYIHLFQRLYPCGECAEHFGQILEKFPPQVSSRSAAAAWGCHVHNEVNKSLGKEVFDCSNIGEFYDCGCAEEEGGKKAEELKDRDGEDEDEDEKPEMSEEAKDRMTGARGRDYNVDWLKDGRRKFEGLKVKGGRRRVFPGLKDKDDEERGS